MLYLTFTHSLVHTHYPTNSHKPGYYVQVLCILQLYAIPRSCALLKSNFLLANGPLAFAVPVWRNSLVFHDVEKITSLYIHIFPGLLTYALKWYPSTQGK